MCGIAGLWSSKRFGANAPAMAEMLAAIRHRGPDADGIWQDESAGLVLGHVRLSILDLSEAGAQPMASGSGRYVVVFNGEIYNHLAVRAELEMLSAHHWRGHSDTETLLAGIEAWGLEATLQRCVGMFALAVWDSQLNILELARDRLGEKPLYYSRGGDQFSFASELKALRRTPGFANHVDRQALCQLLKHGYIPAPQTIYNGARKLLPGQIMAVRIDGEAFSQPDFRNYWSFEEMRADGQDNRVEGTDTEAVNMLEKAIRDSVSAQMLSDVPLGAFLSGGVDSSVVVALMQASSSEPVKTFSIGFNEAGYSELEHAAAIAKYLKTDHTVLVVTPEDALAVIPKLPEIYDEPFADISQIPTYLVSRLAKTRVSVSLSGDGGDELFCGYNRYVWGERIWRQSRRLPLWLRSAIATGVRRVPSARWDWLLGHIYWALPKRWRFKAVGNKVHRLAVALGAAHGSEFYEALTSKWLVPESIVLGVAPRDQLQSAGELSMADMMALDTQTYLPDDILVKVDRAAMACSLETRVPLLDHRLVELAWRLPMGLKIRDSGGKWILKQVLDRYVPRSLMARPKMGFDVPLDSWLRGPLRHWAESLLSAERLEREGYFDVAQIRNKWAEHLSGSCNWHSQLWCVLMFQAWLEKNSS